MQEPVSSEYKETTANCFIANNNPEHCWRDMVDVSTYEQGYCWVHSASKDSMCCVPDSVKVNMICESSHLIN